MTAIPPATTRVKIHVTNESSCCHDVVNGATLCGNGATGVVVVDQIEGHAFQNREPAKVTMNDGAFRTMVIRPCKAPIAVVAITATGSAKYHFQWNCVSIKMTPIAAPTAVTQPTRGRYRRAREPNLSHSQQNERCRLDKKIREVPAERNALLRNWKYPRG